MIFLELDEIIELHTRTIIEHGGSHGLRDKGALESALNAALNRYHYEEASLDVCAATYAYHLSQAHAFIDGNKRIAAIAALTFLRANDARLNVTDKNEVRDLILQIASSEMTRDDVEKFFAERTVIQN